MERTVVLPRVQQLRVAMGYDKLRHCPDYWKHPQMPAAHTALRWLLWFLFSTGHHPVGPFAYFCLPNGDTLLMANFTSKACVDRLVAMR